MIGNIICFVLGAVAYKYGSQYFEGAWAWMKDKYENMLKSNID